MSLKPRIESIRRIKRQSASTNNFGDTQDNQSIGKHSNIIYVHRNIVPSTNSNVHGNREETQSARSHISVVRLSRNQRHSAMSSKISGNEDHENQSICKYTNIIHVNRHELHRAESQNKRRESFTNQNRVTVKKIRRKDLPSTANNVTSNSMDNRRVQSAPNDISKNESQSTCDNNTDIGNLHEKRTLSAHNDIDTRLSSATSIGHITNVQNRISPSIKCLPMNDIKDLVYQKKRKNRKIACRPCCRLCLAILLALLLAGILATVLALLLKHPITVTTTTTTITTETITTDTTTSSTSQTSTTLSTTTTSETTSTTSTTSESSTSTSTSTSSTTTTETTTICTTTGRGTLLSLSGSTPSAWTLYQFNYTATNSAPMIVFGFQNENNRKYYLDTVSVMDNAVANTELLQNENFENSTIAPTGWSQWCTNTCSGHPGIVTSGGSCYAGNCFTDNCYASSGIDFIGQSFSATIGHTYTISFRLFLGGGGTTAANAFYADIT